MPSRTFLATALCGLIVFCAAFCAIPALAQPPAANEMPSVIQVPPEAQPSPHFDATAATNAYLAQIPADKTARSDAYFEGGYWLILWDFLYGSAVALLLLNLRWSARMRDLSERVTRFKPVHTFVYFLQYLVLTSILIFPLSVYEDYFREHKYGLATQTFGPWMADQFKNLGVNLVLGGLLAMLLFGVVRRLPRTWWIWGAVVTLAFTIFTVLIAPVYIVPIFNKVTRLDDPKIVDPILSMARANGIPAKDVYEIDASKQTTRMSANVSGFANTMRITLNDNLLRRGSPEEIQAVMGHEMGHYVMNHVYKFIMFLSIVTVLAFRLPVLGTRLGATALGRKVADSRRRRHGGSSARGAVDHHLWIRHYSDHEHRHPHPGIRSRHVRTQHEPPARRLCPGGNPSRRIPQDESRPHRRMDFL